MIGKVLEAGLREGHEPESWKEELASFHALKGIRHATTALIQLLHPDLPSRSEEGSEEHLERAVCQLVMALAKVHEERQRAENTAEADRPTPVNRSLHPLPCSSAKPEPTQNPDRRGGMSPPAVERESAPEIPFCVR